MGNFTDFFIRRPVFAWVVNILMMLLGLASLDNLTLRQYPRVETPILTIQTMFPGSAASVVETQITNILEESLMRLAGRDSVSSESQFGESTIKVRFNSGVDMGSAVSAVTEVIAAVDLPHTAEKPIITRADLDATPIAEVVLTSSMNSLAQLNDYGNRMIKNQFQGIEGVGSVDFVGGGAYEMRITLDPLKMAFYKVTASEVLEAVKKNNFQKGAGRLRSNEKEINITVNACLNNSADFEKIAITDHRGSGVVYLGDIGSVKVCPRDEDEKIYYNGVPATMFRILAESQANPISVAQKIRSSVEELRKKLPKGIDLQVAMDRSHFIESSLSQVQSTIWEATVLVILVVLLFLRSFRASLIPLMTIPISLVSTLFIMSLFGFSLNILTLLAMVLAIGLVVDDAIVVLENIYRYMEQGYSSLEAALRATREIAPAIIAMTITLAVVYLPIGLSRGNVGRYFSEFALTLAGAVLISGVVSLTLSPTMCARLLKNHSSHGAMQTTGHSMDAVRLWFRGISEKLGKALDALDVAYGRFLRKVLSKQKALFFGLGALVFSLGMGLERFGFLPKMLTPAEDQGMIVSYSLPPLNVDLDYVGRYAQKLDKAFSKMSDIQGRLIRARSAPETQSNLELISIHQRKSCSDILNAVVTPELEKIVGFSTSSVCSSQSPIGGGENKLSFVIRTDQSPKALRKVASDVKKVLRDLPFFQPGSVDVVDMDAYQPQYSVEVDRKKAASLGIDPEQISSTLSTLIQGTRTTKFEKESQQYNVVVVLGDEHKKDPEDVRELYVKGFDPRTRADSLILIKDLVTIHDSKALPTINHYDKQRSLQISGVLREGESLSEAYETITKLLDNEILPQNYTISPVGMLKRYLSESRSIGVMFALALLFIFLVMAAQFESLLDPLIIMLTVPLAISGALIGLYFFPEGSINIFSQIGFLTLIGLITKHGILMVDFANEKQRQGLPKMEAIVQACQLRLRPILMTTFAMVLGALPLAISRGSGAEIRRQIGWTIVGGMSLGTLFTLVIVPIVYLVLSKAKKPETSKVLTSNAKENERLGNV